MPICKIETSSLSPTGIKLNSYKCDYRNFLPPFISEREYSEVRFALDESGLLNFSPMIDEFTCETAEQITRRQDIADGKRLRIAFTTLYPAKDKNYLWGFNAKCDYDSSSIIPDCENYTVYIMPDSEHSVRYEYRSRTRKLTGTIIYNICLSLIVIYCAAHERIRENNPDGIGVPLSQLTREQLFPNTGEDEAYLRFLHGEDEHKTPPPYVSDIDESYWNEDETEEYGYRHG